MSDRPLQRIQLAPEGDATPGTPVDATRILVGGTLDFDAIDEEYRANHPVGLYTINPTTPVSLVRGVDLTYDGDMVVDEFIDFINMSIMDITDPVGGPPHVWLFEPSETGANDPRSYTVERRLTDGTSDNDVEVNFVHARSWTLTQGLNEQTRLSVDMFGRRAKDVANTAALGRLAATFFSSNNWKVYIDNEETAHGAGQITGQIRSFELTYQSGLFPKYFLDGRADLDFGSVGTGPRGIETMRMQVEWGTQAETERDKAADQSLRLIRLEGIKGTEKVIIDCVMRHAKGDFLSVSDADGNDVVDLEFVAAHDESPVATHPAHLEIEITSDNRATL